jgi:tRNA A-37 threonylcarbamoyl transferase component Bud32
MLAEADPICDRFERAWRAGERPRIEDYLAGTSEAGRLIVLRELMAAERELRQRAGERIDPQEYEARFPAHRALIESIFNAQRGLTESVFDDLESLAPGQRDQGHGEATAPFLRETLALKGEAGKSGTIETEPLSIEGSFDALGTTDRPAAPGFGPGPGPGPSTVPGLSQFELLAELGRGGMGVVYKARHRVLNRIVALKMILESKHALAEHHQRFRIEAEAVARLRHPNIVQIYDFGEADGCPYVSLEMLEGGSLADRLKGTTQPSRAAAQLVATLALAIHAAHQAGIVHRDLKPANVLFDRDGTPKITDFGLAKRLEIEEAQTQTGQIMGTPSYMAPEQARGDVHAIGPPADIYALGALLYELLTGRPPFKGSSVMSTLHQVVYDDVVPPSRIESKIARDVETICLKCLAKEPEKRYGSAAELAEDLRAYLENRPIRARRTPLWERGTKWVRRHPTWTTLMGLAVAAGVILVVVGFRLDAERTRQARIKDQAIATLGVRGEQVLFAAQAKIAREDFPGAKVDLVPLLKDLDLEPEPRLALLHSRAAGLLDQVERGITAQKAQEKERQRLRLFLSRRDEALFHQVGFTGLDLPANLKVTREATRAALRVFAEARRGDDDAWVLPALPAALAPGERSEVADGCYELLLALADAVAQPLPGEDARQQAEHGLKILDQAALLRPGSTRGYHMQRAVCLSRQGDQAGKERETALAERLTPSTAADHFLVGQQRYNRRDWNGAFADFDAVLQLQPDHFWAQCLWAICAVQKEPRSPSEAKPALNRCIRQQPGYVWLYLLRAYASGQVAALALETAKLLPAQTDALKAGADSQFAAARADYRKALAMLEQKPNDELRYTLLVNRGVMDYQAGRLEEAAIDLQEAIRHNDRQYEAIATLAQVYAGQKKWDAAVAQFTRALGVKPAYSPLFRERARVQRNRDGRTPEHSRAALADLQEAIRHEQPGSRIVAQDQTWRADLLRQLHRPEDALAACDAALQVVPDDTDANRLRVLVLLDLKRYDEVIGSCDRALAQGKSSAGLHEIRGQARAGRQDFAGAIADYTLELEARPGQTRVLIARGLTYLVTDAPRLALGDFEEALRLEPSNREARIGRGSARVLLGDHRAAVADAAEALRQGDPTARLSYSAARIYAQAAQATSAEARRTGPDALILVTRYQDRAVELVNEALQSIPPEQRAAFWRNQIQTDPALQPLSRRLRLETMGQR